MKCRVEKSEINGDIICPPNKSYTHRAIFIASLAMDKSIIKNILRSEDTDATINAVSYTHLTLPTICSV